MKKLKDNILKKVLPIFLLFILLFNFIAPNYVYGVDWEKVGGVLFAPIKGLLLGIGDSVLELLQNTFVTYDTRIELDGAYKIRYSPGIIFQGTIPGLDINFIDPMEDTNKVKYDSEWNPVIKVTNANQEKAWQQFKVEVEKYLGYLPDEIASEDGSQDLDNYNSIKFYNSKNNKRYKVFAFRDDEYSILQSIWEHFWLLEETETASSAAIDLSTIITDWNESYSGLDREFQINSLNGTGYRFRLKTQTQASGSISFKAFLYVYEGNEWKVIYNDTFQATGKEKTFKEIENKIIEYMREHGGIGEGGEADVLRKNTSISKQLKPSVSKWYKATRLIAMVGLLSVLLYVGIRIIISSTAGDKAKYKKMLMDWLTALCMLFILHYIMVFILTIAKQITGIFINYFMDYDPLMSEIRTTASMDTFGQPTTVFAATLMYIALVILTCVFTFQYLRRVLYMAFLTMIAPLICLTYPLDKIKDGQAQAFTMWIREYIFNALIQPVHLLIYTMLVGSAVELMSVSPIYAIVAISFIVPAEKFIRKMFGFEKANTVGQLGAAAGGALIMNMINKAKHAGAKGHSSSGGSGGGSSSKGVRTPTPAKNSGGPGGNSGSGEGGPGGGPGSGSGGLGGSGDSGDSDESDSSSGSSGTAQNGNSIRTGRSFARRIGGVANAVGKKYKIWGAGAPKQWAKRIAGAYGATALGTIGLAAGIATGDGSNVAKYAGAGVLAGYAGAGGLVESASGLGSTVSEGFWGEEEYGNLQFDKKFYNGQDYLRLKQKYSMMSHRDLKQYTQKFLNAGITDVGKMEKAIDKGLSAEDAIAYNKMAKLCPSNIAGDFEKFSKWVNNANNKNGINLSTTDTKTMFDNMRLFS